VIILIQTWRKTNCLGQQKNAEVVVAMQWQKLAYTLSALNSRLECSVLVSGDCGDLMCAVLVGSRWTCCGLVGFVNHDLLRSDGRSVA